MSCKWMAAVFSLFLFGTMLVPSANADLGNEKMIVKVEKGAVEVPGRVLGPGRYDLQFTSLEHNVLEIRTANGKNAVGFFEVVPVWRAHATNNVKVELSEPSRNSIARVTEFFYPGANTGYEFLYPHGTAYNTNVPQLLRY
jgi:hypothetical protein